MTDYPDPNRVQTVTERTYTWPGWTIRHTDLRRLIGLIMLAFVIVNGMIAIIVYMLITWIITRFSWLLFPRTG